MNKTLNNKAWWLVLPVILSVAFSAIMPLMTVVNYSVQDILGPDQAVFVGTEAEHEIFCGTCGKVPHFKTKDLNEAARVIAGCELFVGNQTSTHAIAEAMKKRIVLEVWREGPNCLVFRKDVIHGWDQFVQLPDL